jgi:hypothetical protein
MRSTIASQRKAGVNTSEPNHDIVGEPGSYRDRSGRVFYRGGRVFRGLSAQASANWQCLQEAAFFPRLRDRGVIIDTWSIHAEDEGLDSAGWASVVEHEPVPFISYPYEWTFGQLKDSALLHLELMQEALACGLILKDATPYNIQWRGVHPVFIDIPSFVPLKNGEPWIGYQQFCELFLYPLMLQAYKGLDFRPWLRGRIDGIPVSEMRGLISGRDVLRRGVLFHVVAQSALQRRYSTDMRDVRGTLNQAGFDKTLIERNVSKLTDIISKLELSRTKTAWSDYDKTHSYDKAAFAEKATFVRTAAATRSWRLAWDLGCNTGTFSRIVANYAENVVAIDGDWMAIEHFYQREKAGTSSRTILPLVMNLADASPNQGWRNAERKGLAERGRPELTLCLALIHHIVISANIPLADFIGWLAELGTAVVIEFVGRDDEMVQTLLANREDQYDDYHAETFRSLLAARFDIRAEQGLKGNKRHIYFAEPRS